MPKNFYLISLLLLVFSACPCMARTYQIDSQATFDSLCTTKFSPGDVILFKRGVQFQGMFAPSGQGNAKQPIRIDVYGAGSKPQIHAGGKHQAGLYLEDPSYWEVNGLEITNTDGTDKDQGTLFGIYVCAKGKEGTYRHIYINDCDVHDVNGKVAGKRRGGIHVHVTDLEATIFDDLRITNNRVSRVGGVGIGNTSSCGRVEFRENDSINHHLWTRVYVAGNTVEYTGRNNIIARVSKDAIYEYNTLAYSSRYSTGHSIFCFNTDGIKIQYNEAYGNVGEGGIDRGGFDADYNCVNTYIQYNYSHDNHWFCGIMKRRNRNVVIRYNISQNDSEGIYFYGFEKNRDARDIHIYNNTHFVRKDLDVSVFPEGRTPLNTRFENNIFCFEGHGTWGKNAKGINTVFRNNLYYNITPHASDKQPVKGNPLLVKPGRSGTNIDLQTMHALKGYRLQSGSPCIDEGIVIQDDGGQDLLGTAFVSSGTDIGAMAYPDTALKAWYRLVGKKSAKRSAFSFIENNPALPNVLIYGDSISIGYTPYVRDYLKDQANVYRLYCNGGDSGSFITKMTEMHSVMSDKNLKEHWNFKWDVIQLNVGLHDLKYIHQGKLDVQKGTQVNSTETYAQNLRDIIAYLKILAPEAKLVFATTTPVPENSSGRKAGDDFRYNRVALKVLKDYPEIAVNDLYGFTKPQQKQWWTRPGNVHFVPEGCEAQGHEVGRVIQEVLTR